MSHNVVPLLPYCRKLCAKSAGVKGQWIHRWALCESASGQSAKNTMSLVRRELR